MNGSTQLIVIGASAGAIEALLALLPALPASYALPIVIVVHVPADKESMLEALFRSKCQMKVCEVEDKEPLHAGTIYFAPPNYHVLIEENQYLSLSNEEPLHYSRPSIDILFESAADVYGPDVVGIILTGANDDGAEGLKAIGMAGGTAIVQQPGMAAAATMPRAALAAWPEAHTLSLTEIATYLQEIPQYDHV